MGSNEADESASSLGSSTDLIDTACESLIPQILPFGSHTSPQVEPARIAWPPLTSTAVTKL
ncbi:MAG TPA: hypothetical protein ENJ18_00270 [Nannocystis exedens]|nr:hypothetical protein [Nannocystis exedens]